MKNLKFFGVFLFLFPMFSWGALIELKGGGASYNANIEWVSNFSIAYLIDTDILDSNPDLNNGSFNGALKSGFLILGSSRYELDLFSSSCNGNISTRDYSDEFVARGTLNFGHCSFINSFGDSVEYHGAFRNYSTDNFFNAGTSLLGLEIKSLYFESDGELSINGMSRYANVHVKTVAPESGSIVLFILGSLGVVGVRLFKARGV